SAQSANVMLCLTALGSVLADLGLPVKVGEAEAAAHQSYATQHSVAAQQMRQNATAVKKSKN
ncbi:MAG: hypothetical protein VB032_03700, partial [Burkholderiaceae bacterium]|nr:hypothetical protein [Burkholderiaceae bacterium]